MGDFLRWREHGRARSPHPELARIVLDESGYTAMLQAERSAEAAGRLENLAELPARWRNTTPSASSSSTSAW